MSIPKPNSPAHKAILAATDADKKRLLSRVVKSGDCWLIPVSRAGAYARVQIAGHTSNAHRATKIWQTGKVPAKKKWACHLCRNKNCINPAHLYWGTYKQNARDRYRDGTHDKAIKGDQHYAAKLSCKKAVAIYLALSKEGPSVKQLAKKYGVHTDIIGNIGGRRAWRHATAHLPDITITQRQRLGMHRRHLTSAILDEQKVKKIRALVKSGAKRTTVADQFGVKPRTIDAIMQNLIWKPLPKKGEK